MSSKWTKVIFLGFLLLFAETAPAAEARPVTFEDIMSLRTVADARISPDGDSVIFTLTSWEEAEKKGGDDAGEMESVSHLYRVELTEGENTHPWQLTFGSKGETSPSWSPDGEWIGFLSARGEGEAPKPQIWILRARGGEAFQLTDAKEGVVAYEWSEDATRIAFTTRDPLPEEDEKKTKRQDDPQVYEGDRRMAHLWTIELASKDARQRTRGTAFTVNGALSWSPDSLRIAFSATATSWVRDQREDVYLLTLEDDAIEKITTNPGLDYAPAFSPDGKSIAFVTTPNTSEPLPDETLIPELRNARLALYDLGSRTISELLDASFDRIPDEPLWSKGGERLLFAVGDGVYREVYAYELGSRRYRKLTRDALAILGNTSRDGSRVAYVSESPQSPPDVYVASADFASSKRVTRMNPEVESLALGASEVISWNSTEGVQVEGVLLKPVGYEPGKKYPLLVVVHGGPTAAHLNFFRLRYGDGGQHWAGQGWAVLYPNPRGSTNYGEEFMRANLADWGGGDYRDILAGVDAVIAMGIADPDRLAIQGWSYGGYMTCWTVSQTTRFKAAMIGAGLTNLVSMYGTNDIPNYLGSFFNGTLSPETDRLYRERSGLTYADRVRTPSLILHGGADERVPIGQPMEFYRALRDRGVPVELVFYPREGHGLQEYYHRLDRMKRQYDWISRYTLGAATN